MNQIDLENWVESETDPQRREFRQAVHLILRAVASSEKLAPCMIMKGGVLLAIRYSSSRFTKDVDFSTRRRLQEVDLKGFIEDFEEALAPVSADNDYGLAVRLQSYDLNPSNKPDAAFPTLQIKIAYANRSSSGEMQRFNRKQSAKTIQIDYSFNEWASDVEEQPLDGGKLGMYAYHDLVAEKLRSVLQQPIRNRSRFQDIYDLCLLLEFEAPTDEDKEVILNKLRAASSERNVPLSREGMRDPKVVELSKREYHNVRALIANNPPEFEEAYEKVKEFFESLPW